MSNTEFKQEVISKCPLCESNRVRFYFDKFDDRYGQPDVFNLYHCSRCDTVFIGNRIMEDEYSALYSKYYTFLSGENNIIQPRRIKSLWIQKIIKKIAGDFFLIGKVKNGSRVLEVGPGNVSQLTLDTIKNNQLSWVGLEVNEKCAESIKNKGLSVYVESSFSDFVSKKRASFDVIILSMSIEHFYDPNIFFSNCIKILNEGGKILLTTANLNSRYRKKYLDKWINWHVPYHQAIFSEKSMDMICKKNGLSLIEYKTITPTSWFLLQRKFKIPPRGLRNSECLMSFSFTSYVIYSLFLRLYEVLSRKSGDCMYCEIIFKK